MFIRSSDYGTLFTRIDPLLTPPTQAPPSLWGSIYVSPINKNLVSYVISKGMVWLVRRSLVNMIGWWML